jgi:hypothetical protein
MVCESISHLGLVEVFIELIAMSRCLQLVTAKRASFPWNWIRAGYRCSLDTVLEPVSLIVSECFLLISS